MCFEVALVLTLDSKWNTRTLKSLVTRRYFSMYARCLNREVSTKTLLASLLNMVTLTVIAVDLTLSDEISNSNFITLELGYLLGHLEQFRRFIN